MDNLITAATHMFNGFLLTYRDSVIEYPDGFATQAVHLIDRFLASVPPLVLTEHPVYPPSCPRDMCRETPRWSPE